ncbi:hypothetical protein F2Q69_00010816 [Brassica cretica]|uniref:Uncharacterized protein n=1 Tax=Brassica cretica TaxID=69181 RepID=A0A8S9R8G8_BRACR|nr:hypothetical protein F2Q69_00010816 [Brassica cretica]
MGWKVLWGVIGSKLHRASYKDDFDFVFVFRGLNYIYESRQKTMRGCFIFSIRVFFSWFAIDNFHLLEEEAYEEAEEEETKDETAI